MQRGIGVLGAFAFYPSLLPCSLDQPLTVHTLCEEAHVCLLLSVDYHHIRGVFLLFGSIR
jgi:hypothetical protein